MTDSVFISKSKATCFPSPSQLFSEIKKANEAEAALAKQQTEEEGSAELDEQGQARRDEAHEKRIQDVQVVFRKENKETLEPIQQAWDNNKKDNDLEPELDYDNDKMKED